MFFHLVGDGLKCKPCRAASCKLTHVPPACCAGSLLRRQPAALDQELLLLVFCRFMARLRGWSWAGAPAVWRPAAWRPRSSGAACVLTISLLPSCAVQGMLQGMASCGCCSLLQLLLCLMDVYVLHCLSAALAGWGWRPATHPWPWMHQVRPAGENVCAQAVRSCNKFARHGNGQQCSGRLALRCSRQRVTQHMIRGADLPMRAPLPLAAAKIWEGVANRYWRLPVYFVPTCVLKGAAGEAEAAPAAQRQGGDGQLAAGAAAAAAAAVDASASS